MTKKLKIQMNGRSDEFGTPKEAIEVLLPYLKEDWKIWECAWGKGSLAKHLMNKGFKVCGSEAIDFLNINLSLGDFDCIITNPPYSKKEEFLNMLYTNTTLKSSLWVSMIVEPKIKDLQDAITILENGNSKKDKRIY